MPPFPEDVEMADDYNASSVADEESFSTEPSLSRHEPTSGADEDQASPETLVRRENRAINVARAGVLVLLMAATAVTALLIQRSMSKSEQDAFESTFDSVADKIVESMKSDLLLKLWMVRSIANTAAVIMGNNGSSSTNFTLPPETWDSITEEARFIGKARVVSWSPLLETESERESFETFVASQEVDNREKFICYFCGGEGRGYTNPDDLVDIPGFGSFPCGDLELSGLNGGIPEDGCQLLAQVMSATCKCGDLPKAAGPAGGKAQQSGPPPHIFELDQEGSVVYAPANSGPYSPIWLTESVDNLPLSTMYDQLSEPVRAKAIVNMRNSYAPALSEVFVREGPYYEQYGSSVGVTSSVLFFPVVDPSTGKMMASVNFEILWESFLTSSAPPYSEFVDFVLETSCGQKYTYKIDVLTNEFHFVQEGDGHDPRYDHTVHMSTYSTYEDMISFVALRKADPSTLDYCRYRFLVYASKELENEFITNKPLIYALIIAGIFLFTSAVFVLYDSIVKVRQAKVMASAKRTNDIVATLFPQNVRDRLFDQRQENGGDTEKKSGMSSFMPSKVHMQSFLNDGQGSLLASEPIADLFPQATVMFLDIAGFTAWSSEREPGQVFKLLETIYQSFDQAARTLGVFKVETIGDSYVAVCGLPQHRDNHAPVMATFARHCLKRMARITKELEVLLGPDTGDLCARVGLNSGPVTAGVLRGEKARFQLFGDTVNTAARLESSGKPNQIQCSKATRDLLVAAGKESWVRPRADGVHLKGKGEMHTFWVDPKGGSMTTASVASSSGCESGDEADTDDAGSIARLIDWNVEVLHSLLDKVVSSRVAKKAKPASPQELARAEEKLALDSKEKIVMDEMTQILPMPEFDKSIVDKKTSAIVDSRVKDQLREFVTIIANMYRDVPFHNFAHASHVIMSAGKLMRRIVQPDGIDYQQEGVANEKEKALEIARQIHKASYGISSDPLLQFAVVFSALIHDVDHTGLTNAELVKMGAPVSATYRGKSVAEQNSVTLSWNVLMDNKFKELRACIYTNETELRKFRQLLVNALIATDIADKELKSLRESRWDTAFSDNSLPLSSQLDFDRRATIVFEYIIQASDISHTMQHWMTYIKFNERLFQERYLAWVKGHSGEKDPSEGWYGGEIWFFDNYIIPLARKLHKCGVFGVSYHELLTYAEENRREWQQKGKGIVAEMLAKCQKKYGTQVEVPGDTIEI